MRRISRTQQEVLDLMAKDWELGATGGINPSFWLQKGGIGKSGESKTISSTTFFALLGRKLIEVSSTKFPFTYYRLTELGED